MMKINAQNLQKTKIRMSSSVFIRAAKLTRARVQKKMGPKYLPYNHLALIGDPILRQPAAEFDVNVYNSVDMKTFEQHNPAIMKSLSKMEKFAQYGWVITAPQVGLPMKIMLVQLHLGLDDDGFTIKGTDKTKNYVFANPEIRPLTNEKAFSIESSLSIPALSGVVERHQLIELTAYDLAARRVVKMTLSPPDSFMVQNAVDQLNGVMFIDKVTDKNSVGVLEYDLVRSLGDIRNLEYFQQTNLPPAGLDIQKHLTIYKGFKTFAILTIFSTALFLSLQSELAQLINSSE